MVKNARTPFFLVILVLLLVIIGCNNVENYTASVESVVENYLTAVKNQDIDGAYNLLDKSNLPDKETFKRDIESKKLDEFKVVKSKTLDDDSYKVLTNLKVEGVENETVFLLKKIEDKWEIHLNTDPSKENLEF